MLRLRKRLTLVMYLITIIKYNKRGEPFRAGLRALTYSEYDDSMTGKSNSDIKAHKRGIPWLEEFCVATEPKTSPRTHGERRKKSQAYRFGVSFWSSSSRCAKQTGVNRRSMKRVFASLDLAVWAVWCSRDGPEMWVAPREIRNYGPSSLYYA